jgi:hypothetical protein
MADPVIRIMDLWKNYGGDGSGVPALRGTNIEIKKEDLGTSPLTSNRSLGRGQRALYKKTTLPGSPTLWGVELQINHE